MAERIMHHSGCVERMGGWSCHPHCEIRARRAPALELDRLRAELAEAIRQRRYDQTSYAEGVQSLENKCAQLRARCGELEAELAISKTALDYIVSSLGPEKQELAAARERLAAWEPVILAVFRMVRATWNRNQFYDSLGSDMRKAIGAIPKEHAPGMDQLCRTLDVPPLSPPLGPRDAAIVCVKCGKPVEDVRRCYAIPHCYACLPPPPPIEPLYLNENLSSVGPRDAARGGDETSGASPRGSSDPAPIHGDYGRGQAQEPGPAAAREPEEAATLLDTARSEQSGSGPAEAGGLASVPRAGVADNTGTFSPAPSGEVCNGERASESRLQITPRERELADELLEAPRTVTFDSYSAPSGEPARAQMYREQTPDGAPLPAPSGEVCTSCGGSGWLWMHKRFRCGACRGTGRAERKESAREIAARLGFPEPSTEQQERNLKHNLKEIAERQEPHACTREPCPKCDEGTERQEAGPGATLEVVHVSDSADLREVASELLVRVRQAEKERDELRARLAEAEQWKLDAQAVLTDALGDFYESDWTDKANALLEDKPAQSVLLAEKLKAAEAERDVLAGALRELRDAEEAFLEHDSPTSFGRMSAARAAADALLKGEK